MKKRISIKEEIFSSAGVLIGIAIALAIVLTVAGLTVLNASTSSGLVSAANQIAQFLGLIGLGIAVGVLVRVFGTDRNR